MKQKVFIKLFKDGVKKRVKFLKEWIKKHVIKLFILFLILFLLIGAIAGGIYGYIESKPIYFTKSEMETYESIAKAVKTRGLEETSIDFEKEKIEILIISDTKIIISSTEEGKGSIDFDFSNSLDNPIVNLNYEQLESDHFTNTFSDMLFGFYFGFCGFVIFLICIMLFEKILEIFRNISYNYKEELERMRKNEVQIYEQEQERK